MYTVVTVHKLSVYVTKMSTYLPIYRVVYPSLHFSQHLFTYFFTFQSFHQSKEKKINWQLSQPYAHTGTNPFLYFFFFITIFFLMSEAFNGIWSYFPSFHGVWILRMILWRHLILPYAVTKQQRVQCFRGSLALG